MLKWFGGMVAASVCILSSLQIAQAAHQIDIAVQECILERSSVAGTSVCSQAGAEEWEDEVERVYEFLEERYQDQARQDELGWLVTSQAQWESYRRVYFAMLANSCRGDSGCVAQTAAERMRFWRSRYMELEGLIDCQTCFEPYEG